MNIWDKIGLFLVCFFYDLGISWEKLGKNLELLVLVFKQLQKYLGTSWELRGNNLGITWEKVDICLE
jgi:hypothetical protein